MRSSLSFLVGGALLGAAVFLGGCVTETTGDTNPDTSGLGGSGNAAGAPAAGTGGTAGAGAGGAGAAGAGAGGAGAGGEAGAGAGGAGAGGEAGAAGAGAGGAPVEEFGDVRLAHLNPDLGKIDVCFKQTSGTEWTGPLFKSINQADQFYYPAVTSYIQLGAGMWEVRLVAENAANCDTGLAGLSDQPFQVSANGSLTVALEGDNLVSKATSIVDRGAPAAGKVGYQAHNALTETGAVDFGLLDENNAQGPTFLPVANNLIALTVGGSADADPSAFRPTFLVSGSNPPVIAAQSPAVDMAAGEVYFNLIHGTKATDPNEGLRPSAIICRNFLTSAEKTANNEYVQDDGSNVISTHCVYGPNVPQQ